MAEASAVSEMEDQFRPICERALLSPTAIDTKKKKIHCNIYNCYVRLVEADTLYPPEDQCHFHGVIVALNNYNTQCRMTIHSTIHNVIMLLTEACRWCQLRIDVAQLGTGYTF